MPKVTSSAAETVAQAAAKVAVTAATGGAVADVALGLQIFQELEPSIQHALAALFHKLHHPELAAATTPAKPDLSSTSLDPDVQAP